MSNYDCPICGQYMDFFAITYRNHPYIDGHCYKRMCFCCAHAPMKSLQQYDEEGNIIDEDGPFFDYRHLLSVEEMVRDRIASEEEAKQSLRGIKRRIQEIGAVSLRKLKLSRPKQEYEFNPEFEAAQSAKWSKKESKKYG